MEELKSIIKRHEEKMIELLADKPVRTSITKLGAAESISRILDTLYKMQDNAKIVKSEVKPSPGKKK